MSDTIKLSSPPTRQFWEIPVLFEDGHFLALAKPPQLLTSPDRLDPQRPSLVGLLHQGIQRGAPWARERNLSYLMNTHRLEPEASGVLLLAKGKPDLIAMANLFGSEKVVSTFVALVRGVLPEESRLIAAKLAPQPGSDRLMRVGQKGGTRSQTQIEIRERFDGYTLLECRPFTPRQHQVRAHLQHIGFPVLGDLAYGGRLLLLSELKSAYRLKPRRTERPLLSQPALHAEALAFVHPATGAEIKMVAPWPKDLTVAVKYLRRYAGATGGCD